MITIPHCIQGAVLLYTAYPLPTMVDLMNKYTTEQFHNQQHAHLFIVISMEKQCRLT